MDTRRLAVGSIAVPLIAFLCIAGIRGPGKYAGVVIFDRWGGCTLYSGVYVMYVAEAVKEQLRSRAGQCVEINATQVEQEHNPGDGLIKAFTYLGAPPSAPEWAEPVAGIRLSMQPRFLDGQKPAFELRLENAGQKPLTVHLDSLAPTVLNRIRGTSFAVITRDCFWVDGPRVEGANDTWHWSVTAPAKFERQADLQPKTAITIDLSFRLPPGEYDVFAGYGGGVHEYQCLASNLTGIDVGKDGRAKLAKVAGR